MLTKDFLIFANCAHGIDAPIGNSEDIIQVELPNGEYKDIKEFFCLSNPNRIIIRLENNNDR